MQGSGPGGFPFSGFGFPSASFGALGRPFGNQNLLSSFLEGRDPFDNPFFTHPFGGMFDSSFFGSSLSPFPVMPPAGYIEDQIPGPKISRGPIIEEISSDDEKDITHKVVKENNRKHGRPYVEEPDNEALRRRNRHLQLRNDISKINNVESHPQTHSFTFHSSSTTYGGVNGAYYTSSTMKRTGSDGVTIEESKEADTASRQASHMISKGLHNKGHTLTRKLKSDGRVDTMQTLRNIDEDEIVAFEKAWEGNARKHLPGWMGDIGSQETLGVSAQQGRGIQALPSAEGSRDVIDHANGSGSSRSHHMGKDVRGRNGNARGKASHI